jgi:hypothetical protein
MRAPAAELDGGGKASASVLRILGRQVGHDYAERSHALIRL